MQKYAAHVLVKTSEDKILLVRRKDVPVWVLPGGGFEKGETVKQTARREFQEETGILLKEPLRAVCHYFPSSPASFDKYILYYYLEKEYQPKLTNESCDFGYFLISQLPFPMTLYEQKRIEEANLAIIGKKIKRLDKVEIHKEILYFLRKPHFLVYLLSKFVIQKIKFMLFPKK